MTMLDPDLLKVQADRMFLRKKLLALGLPFVVLGYLTYIFFAFDIVGLAQRAKIDNAVALVSDTYSYKTHVTRSNRADGFTIAIEGERKGTYAEGTSPDWVSIDGETADVTLPKGNHVQFDGNAVTVDITGYGTVTANADRRGLNAKFPSGEIPDFINASNTRITITLPGGRVTITKAKTEVYRYFFGWELFWFTLDSPYYGKGPLQLLSLALSTDRIEPAHSNFVGMVQDFWTNEMWRHSDVAWAIGETILMAFLGTFGAAMVALPLSFLAAKNFTPNMSARFGLRRFFDFLRGVDALIWTIVLARAFGPGPLTGALAILITDTGSFGKIFSEALENVDGKQIEGIRSTGAKPVQRYRFGVLPQVTPVLLSQVLYFFESNTRSATIIGAIVGGGIGLLLTQAIITQKDWEEVTYYIVLVIVMVMLMDWLSGIIRNKIIKGSDSGH